MPYIFFYQILKNNRVVFFFLYRAIYFDLRHLFKILLEMLLHIINTSKHDARESTSMLSLNVTNVF